MILEFIEWLERICEELGCPDYIQNNLLLISILLIAIAVMFFGVKWIRKGYLHITKWKELKEKSKDLYPYYTSSDVNKATKFYVQSYYQNVAPSEDEEPGSLFSAVPKDLIIPKFIKDIFRRSINDNKYHLVFADAGMGKTTFLINLFIRYRRKLRSPWYPVKYEIVLLPLAHSEILELIPKIEEPSNTILLLDALDENVEAGIDSKAFLESLLSVSSKFRCVLITCRTQFFPSKHEEPEDTGYLTYGEHGEFRFQKNYLSVFSDSDVKKYLWKRFKFQLRSFKKAKSIASKIENLVMRPLILSYVEDLVSMKEEDLQYTSFIYDEMIKRWIDREAGKPSITTFYQDKFAFKLALHDFSKKIAFFIYQKREFHGGYFVPPNSSFDHKIFQEELISGISEEVSEKIAKSKSLLNRDSVGRIKFSHKSIFEYLIAKVDFESKELVIKDFTGMDMSLSFIKEFLEIEIKQLKGEWFSKVGIKSLRLSSYTFDSDFYILRINEVPDFKIIKSFYSILRFELKKISNAKMKRHLVLKNILTDKIYNALVHKVLYSKTTYEIERISRFYGKVGSKSAITELCKSIMSSMSHKEEADNFPITFKEQEFLTRYFSSNEIKRDISEQGEVDTLATDNLLRIIKETSELASVGKKSTNYSRDVGVLNEFKDNLKGPIIYNSETFSTSELSNYINIIKYKEKLAELDVTVYV